MSHYDNWRNQYRELYAGAGLAKVASTQIELTGPDAPAFLNRLCTNKVDRLMPGAGCEAFLTDAKGHVVAWVLVFRRAESLVLRAAAGQAEKIVAHLDRYLIRDKVELNDQSPRQREFLLAGEKAEDVLCGLAALVPANEHLAHVDIDSCGIRGSVRRLALGGSRVFLISVDMAGSDVAWQSLQSAGARPCGPSAAESLRIEAGWPDSGTDITEENLPQEIGRDRLAISFDKGCYLGQETVARIESRGHVNRLLVGLQFSTSEIPPHRTELSDGEKLVGNVTSAAYSPRLGTALALGYVARRLAEAGTRLNSTQGTVAVVDLPLQDDAAHRSIAAGQPISRPT